MTRVFQKIVLLVAIVTVIGHSIFPHFHSDEITVTAEKHQHHDEQSSGSHHHDNDDNKDNPHSIFSFAQLDDDFIPVNGQFKNFELPAEYLPALIITFLPENYSINTKPHFGWYFEYPPPDDYLYNLPSRAPPSEFLS